MGKGAAPESALAHPGPYGYPVRFGVRQAGPKGYKIYGANHRDPMRYIEWHTRRFILHHSGHKKPGSPALITVHENWSPGSEFPEDDHKPTYTITVHGQDSNASQHRPHTGPDGIPATHQPTASPTADQLIGLVHTHCRPVTFQFQLPIATSSSSSSTTTTTTTLETFEWRRAPINCHETRGIRCRKLPALETGDRRPLRKRKRVWCPNGSILVWVRKGSATITATAGLPPTPAAATPPTRAPTDTPAAPPTLQPLGYTPSHEPILASYTTTRDCHASLYFQFWGPAASGSLGETFTHVAVASGMAVWHDEKVERRLKGEFGDMPGEGAAGRVVFVGPGYGMGFYRV